MDELRPEVRPGTWVTFLEQVVNRCGDRREPGQTARVTSRFRNLINVDWGIPLGIHFRPDAGHLIDFPVSAVELNQRLTEERSRLNVDLPIDRGNVGPSCAATEPQPGGIMQREIGQRVVYVDKYGKPRDALVTQWWHQSKEVPDSDASVNLVFISSDVQKDDTYGRQLERETSVVHKSNQSAHGFYWCWPDEIGF